MKRRGGWLAMMGGVVMGQIAGYMLDHGYSYAPVLVITGSLHVVAYTLLLTVVRSLKPSLI